MIEELAKAICCPGEACKYDPGKPQHPCGSFYWRTEARAVLARLRDPTPGMVKSGSAATDAVFIDGVVQPLAELEREITNIFRAMIDAALAEPQELGTLPGP